MKIVISVFFTGRLWRGRVRVYRQPMFVWFLDKVICYVICPQCREGRALG
jgi:hypothetical protein